MPYYRLTRGQLPEGLHLTPSGVVRGLAAHAGDFGMMIEIDNGCSRVQMPLVLAVRGRPILTVRETEIELTSDKPEAVIRVSGDRPGLAYTASPSDSWVQARPLRGHTPELGDSLADDVLTIRVDLSQFETNPDGPSRPREATVHLTCFQCISTTIKVAFR
jgi:hypothetical protein